MQFLSGLRYLCQRQVSPPQPLFVQLRSNNTHAPGPQESCPKVLTLSSFLPFKLHPLLFFPLRCFVLFCIAWILHILHPFFTWGLLVQDIFSCVPYGHVFFARGLVSFFLAGGSAAGRVTCVGVLALFTSCLTVEIHFTPPPGALSRTSPCYFVRYFDGLIIWGIVACCAFLSLRPRVVPPL